MLENFVREGSKRPANYRFRCALCGSIHAKGHVYGCGPLKREVCKFCEDTILNKRAGTKLIYIAMGNKK